MALPKKIVVDLSSQVLTAYEGSQIIFIFNCATGDSQNVTPTGRFKITRKHAKYTSRTYKVPMDNAMFFNEGIAIHESPAAFVSYLKLAGLNYFGSHGCVRLSKSDAVKLFNWTPMDTPVEVVP